MAVVKVSWDPGTNHTGYCVFTDGKPTEWGIIEPPKAAVTYLQKALSIFGQATALLERVRPEAVAVEAFSSYHSNDDKIGIASKHTMMKCSGIQMGLVWVAWLHCRSVDLVSKGNISKRGSEQLAKAYGVTPTKKGLKDDIDAFQIGICAGFDKRG